MESWISRAAHNTSGGLLASAFLHAPWRFYPFQFSFAMTRTTTLTLHRRLHVHDCLDFSRAYCEVKV